MGSEADHHVFSPTFNKSIRVISRDDRLSSHAGALLVREISHRLGITRDLAEAIYDPRHPMLRRYELEELIDARVMGIACGLAAQDAQDQLAHDPALRAASWHRPGECVADERTGSQPTHSRALGIITRQPDQIGMMLAEVIRRHRQARGEKHLLRRGTLDIDVFPVTVHGRQEDAAYNGYYARTVYQPLTASFAPWGDYDHSCLGDGVCRCPPGRHRADWGGSARLLRQAVRNADGLAQCLDTRFDAGLACGTVMDGLKDDGTRFVARLRNNARLDAMALPYLTRPAGRPPAEGYQRVIEMGSYQAPDWRHSFRLVLVIVDAPDPVTGCLQLFPNHFFLITSWEENAMLAEALLEHYRGRGTFEDRFSELNRALNLHLSCHAFDRNESTLLLHLLAFNLANVLRAELERATGSGWDLGRFQDTVLNAAARLVHAGRQLRFYLASAAAAVWQILLGALDR